MFQSSLWSAHTAPCRNTASNLLHARKTIPVNVMFYSRLLSSSALAPSLTPIIWIYFHKLRRTFMAVWALTFCWFSVLVQAHVARLPVYLYAALRSFDQHCQAEGMRVRFAFSLMDRQSLDFRVKRAGWVAELKMKHLQLSCPMSNFLNMLMLLKSGWLENTKLDQDLVRII